MDKPLNKIKEEPKNKNNNFVKDKLFGFLSDKKKLTIAKQNKELQTKLDVGSEDYKKNSH